MVYRSEKSWKLWKLEATQHFNLAGHSGVLKLFIIPKKLLLKISAVPLWQAFASTFNWSYNKIFQLKQFLRKITLKVCIFTFDKVKATLLLKTHWFFRHFGKFLQNLKNYQISSEKLVVIPKDLENSEATFENFE